MTSRLTVDLHALGANYLELCTAAAPATVAAVVKADAYGLGATIVGQRLWQSGCREFFVATVAEAEALRAAMAGARIYVFAGAECDTADRLVAVDAVPILNHAAQLELWRGRCAEVALHVDTGMNRLGFDAAAMATLDLGGANVSLVVSHLACADGSEDPLTDAQYAQFDAICAQFPDARRSIANSAAALTRKSRPDELCRPGIALYGGNPFDNRENPMAAVVRFEARVLQLREVDHDQTVGYGATYRARGKRLIAVVGAGYADGMPRLLGNLGVAAVRGQRVPYVGRVSMDLITLDVSEVASNVAVGDWVELIGDVVTLDEVAALARTIGYEILTGLGRRSERVYRG